MPRRDPMFLYAQQAHGWLTIAGAARTTTKALPVRMATLSPRSCQRSDLGCGAFASYRKVRRARWQTIRHAPETWCAIPIWNGPIPMGTPRNTPPPVGPALSAIFSDGLKRRATTLMSLPCMIWKTNPNCCRAMPVPCLSGTTSIGAPQCATLLMATSKTAVM